MKKVYILITALVMQLAFYSCTPQQLSGNEPVSETCCSDDGPILPPPPPPGGGG